MRDLSFAVALVVVSRGDGGGNHLSLKDLNTNQGPTEGPSPWSLSRISCLLLESQYDLGVSAVEPRS